MLNVLLPVEDVYTAELFLPLAKAIAGNSGTRVTLVGISPAAAFRPDAVRNPAAVLADGLDRLLEKFPGAVRHPEIFASSSPFELLRLLISKRNNEEDLVLLPWRDGLVYTRQDLDQVLRDYSCNVVVAKAAALVQRVKKILLPVRGGPYARLSLRLAIGFARYFGAEVTLLRVLQSDDDAGSQMLREEFDGLSDSFPEITSELQVVGDAGATISRELANHQMVILGASASPDMPHIGFFARCLMERHDLTTVVLKTREAFRFPESAAESHAPVIVHLERWFQRNTFHNSDFSDVNRLIDLKKAQTTRISLCLPSLNEENTIGEVIRSIKGPLMDDAPLLDEILLIDSGSTDATRAIASSLGAKVHQHQDILPRYGSHRGKGEALWKSLYALEGDLIVFLDTDIANPHPKFIYGILGPLLADERIQYVKGFYKRGSVSGDLRAAGGGRVTELMARPIINLFFPSLSGIIQPLSGIYGGRRSALERVPFYSGYGVEVGLLLNILEKFGLASIAQAGLDEVIHRNQGLHALGKMSFAILQVFANHLRERGVIDSKFQLDRTMKLVDFEQQQPHLHEFYVHEHKRPAMVELREYASRPGAGSQRLI